MKTYNSKDHLIAIHVPKTAGTSVKNIFKHWFKENMHLHYYDGIENRLPDKVELDKNDTPKVIYGHFNSSKKFGISDYYPQVNQFTAILREPFQRVISGYKYLSRSEDINRRPNTSLENYLIQNKSNFLYHFPTQVTEENYIDVIESMFIEIGVIEHLHESMTRIAQKLNKPFNVNMIKKLNVSKENFKIPYHVKDQFIENHALEYKVYEYVLSKYS